MAAQAEVRVRLKEGLSVLWRERGAAQIGTDPRCGVVLHGLTDAEQALLDLVPSGLPLKELIRAGQVAGIAAGRVQTLVDAMERAGVLVSGDVGLPGTSGQRGSAAAQATDAAYWGRLRPDGDGWSVLARRHRSSVALLGAGRLGMLIASGLATAGVGTVLLSDRSPVSARDVAPGAFRPADVGRSRETAGAEVLLVTRPALRTTAALGTRPDLCVLVDHAVASPVRSRPLVREDLAHLSVVVGDVDVVVGPLVVPGDGPCLRCLDLHRCDADDRWPAVATQLAAEPETSAESSLAPLAAAVAVGQVLAHLDGRVTDTRGATLEVAAITPLPRRRIWTAHPDCGCSCLSEMPSTSG